MTPNRTNRRVAAGVLVLLLLGGATAFAADLDGLQLFAPADISPYGRGPQPHQGYFFRFDGLYWDISAPKTTKIGDSQPQEVFFGARPTLGGGIAFESSVQESTADTGMFGAPFVPGIRVEFGRVEGHHGWLCSVFKLNQQTQDPILLNVPINFQDPFVDPFSGRAGLITGPFATVAGVTYVGPLPTVFDIVTVRNEVNVYGVELSYVYRTGQFHNGSYMEWFLGPRYMEFNEEFDVDAWGGTLGNSYWYTSVENHLIGGQAGVRWFKKYSRFMLNAEGRFFAAYNAQNFKQNALLGDQLVFNRGANGFPDTWQGSHPTSHDFHGEWAPCAELRVELVYQLTRSMSLRAGYNAMWADGIARAVRSVRYEVPTMGIDASDNREGIFINGISVGVDFNR